MMIEVQENVTAGFLVTTLRAEDEDIDEGSEISYKLLHTEQGAVGDGVSVVMILTQGRM